MSLFYRLACLILNRYPLNFYLSNSAEDPDPDPLYPQDFGFLDPDPQKYADQRIRIQGVKNQPKTAEKNSFTP